MEQAVARRDVAGARRAYLDARSAFRRLLPFASLLKYSSSLESEADEPDETPADLGFRPLGKALLSEPPDFVAAGRALKRSAPAARLALSEATVMSLREDMLALSSSRAVFRWGQLLDGSRAETSAEARIDVLDAGEALVRHARRISELSAGLPGKGAGSVPDGGTSSKTRKPSNAKPAGPAELVRAARAFDAWLGQRRKEPDANFQHKLEGLSLSAELGAAFREVFSERGAKVPAPFAALHPPREHPDAVSVATFPRLPGRRPHPLRVALGKRLFFDKRLSKRGDRSCASCHLERFALSSGPKRPAKFDGTRLSRDVPGLWNTAYEAMFFWDGRASTLSRQIQIAVESDMGGDWTEIVDRLKGDPNFAREMFEVFGSNMTAGSLRAAMAEYERTLVSASTPFDRYVRGERDALTTEQLRGFDVFYGVARCSRCHKLPLTSGTAPPRFVTSELSVVGVPVAPKQKRVDPDPGRGAITKRPEHAHAFKVPTLRHLTATAPYFHNGAFRSLEEVVDFYAAGSAAGLELELPQLDPDAGAFSLTSDERRTLLAFLRDGLGGPPTP